MGVTTFICKIDSVEDFSKAVKAVISHNVSPMEWDGSSYYTDEDGVWVEEMLRGGCGP